MNKTIIFISLAIILSPTTTFAWNDCPHGEVNDKYPGACSHYIDTDKNGICDHSEPSPEERKIALETQAANTSEDDLISGRDLKTKTVKDVARIYQINAQEYAQKLSEFLGYNVNPTSSFQLLHDNYGLEPSVAKDIATSIKTDKPLQIESNSKNKNTKIYPVLLLTIIVTIFYAITYFLSKINKITLVRHRLIWNFVLLFSFLISGILGVLLALKENFGIIIPLPFNIVVWHVNAGIVMVIVSLFHIAWHWPYFKSIFRTK